ncbi:FkbM family methyltransferase [Bradyrhizobium sp. SYSU BS000235]|uniref:FkbM family methyltransferase n=1 Tax=Bradyrhizobium sp. SYSU BS000235 TaxID=3411332 RepID=UPI003C7126E8
MRDQSRSDQKPFGAHTPNAMQRLVIAAAHGSGLKRGAFRPWLSRLVHLFGAGPIDTTYQGASFRLHHLASGTERGALFNPDYNLPELDFLREHSPRGSTFVDVGANVGTYAVALAKHVGTTGRVIAIEPHPVSNARLAFNAAASNLSNLTLVRAAAGDVDGELLIETDGENLGASHISATGGFKVPAHRLLTILQNAGVSQVHALKIDVEGYEDRVLTGFFHDAPQSLWPQAIAIEHLERKAWLNDCIADMISRGYGVAGKTRSNTLLVRR